MRIRRVIALIAIVVGAVAATGLVPLDARPAAIRLFDVTTARGVVDGRPFEPTQVFSPDDNPVYVWYRAEGCTAGTVISTAWYYLETEPPLRFCAGTVTVERPDDWGQFNFKLGPGRRWSMGRYRVELSVGGELLAEATFRVSPRDTVAMSPVFLNRPGPFGEETCREKQQPELSAR